ncbi:DUF5106 domain-containing protein [uncultured Rikenella sp.]|uniref:DUF5106 domain-containing protein n=1 Tax=uncultured Rikenella sp. TaxID=368003 RepID=UPI0026044044|nr:DUF5106 domain-containing protein [uncultured Rikenella sp.]
MNLKIAWIVGISAAFVACGGGQQKPKPEASWQREAKFRTFLNLSMTASVDSARHILDTLLDFYGKDSAALRQMVDFLTPPLSDPNSQIRNDELYIPLLEAMIASPFYDSTEKVRPRYRLEMARKNRVGQPAADFAYTLADGKRGNLYAVEAPFTLVYINNPDCHACEEILQQLSGSSVIDNQQKSGRLKIVAIYPDKDLGAWRKHLKETPETWINGYDAELAIRRQELYDLRAIPSLYLLDRDKKVLLKDCTSVDLIEAWLIAE